MSVFLASLFAVGAADAVVELQPQQRGSRLAIAGNQLVVADAGSFELWDVSARKLVARAPSGAPDVALGVVQGNVVGVTGDVLGDQSRFVRFKGPAPEIITLDHSAAFAHADRVVAAGGNDFWVSEPPLGFSRFRVGAGVERLESRPWEMNQALTFTAAAEPGAALYYESRAIVRIRSNGAREAFAVPVELANPQHLAAGPRAGTVWATTREAVYLVELRGKTASPVSRWMPGGVVYHIASAGPVAAVLSVDMQVGAWKTVTLSAIAASGQVSWTQQLPVPVGHEAWVAGSATHVAVLLGDEIRVCSARDGSSVFSERRPAMPRISLTAVHERPGIPPLLRMLVYVDATNDSPLPQWLLIQRKIPAEPLRADNVMFGRYLIGNGFYAFLLAPGARLTVQNLEIKWWNGAEALSAVLEVRTGQQLLLGGKDALSWYEGDPAISGYLNIDADEVDHAYSRVIDGDVALTSTVSAFFPILRQ